MLVANQNRVLSKSIVRVPVQYLDLFLPVFLHLRLTYGFNLHMY